MNTEERLDLLEKRFNAFEKSFIDTANTLREQHIAFVAVELNLEVDWIKRIAEFPDYWIVRTAKVWSNKSNKFLSPGKGKRGYKLVILSNGETKKTKTIHRLVAEAFIPNPDNKPQVNHKDRNRLNNKLDNLEWVTALENQQDSYKKGRIHNKPSKGKFGEEHWSSKTVYQYDSKGILIHVYSSVMEAQRRTGIDFSRIATSCRSEKRKCEGFIWRYDQNIENFFDECIICNQKFSINRKGQKYCSKNCNKKAFRQRKAMKWMKENE